MKIKVVSINVYLGGRLWDNLTEFIIKEKPDVLLLQEVFNSSDENLPEYYRTFNELKKLGYAFGSFEIAFIYDDDNGFNPEGNAVLSIFPINSSEKFLLIDGDFKQNYKDIPENWPNLPRIAQHCRILAKQQEINVINVQGIWDLAGDNPSENRQKMINRIIEKTKGLKNVIIAGDTNANINNPVLNDLAKLYKAVFGKELTSTFNMKRKTNPGYATAAVDLMFVSNEINVISKKVPQVDISDHLPIVVELELPD